LASTHALLALAIISEVAATISLKSTAGFTRLLPTLVVLIGYGTAFFLLSLILARGLPVGMVYGIWSAAGVALVALIGIAFLGESLTYVQGVGLGLVALGVLAIEMGAAH
jgi:small multidrug resistance pump